MALKTVTIPITDHDTAGCTNYYMVRYKAAYGESWQNLSPNPTSGTITITGLSPSTQYNLEITRVCCDGTTSNVMQTTFTTTP